MTGQAMDGAHAAEDRYARAAASSTVVSARRAGRRRTPRDQSRDRALLARFHRDRDPQIRDALVERYLPLATSVARRYSHSSASLDDVTQVACLALVKAVDRFDPAVGVAFSSYAVPCIVGEIKRHYRDCTWAVHVPRDLQELALRIERTAEALSRELRRQPATAEIADRLGVSIDAVLEARHARRAYRADSLQRRRGNETDDETIDQSIGETDPAYARAEDRELLRLLARQLTPSERLVLQLRFEHELSQTEIALYIGASQTTVSRILRAVVERLQVLARHHSTAPSVRSALES